MDAEVLICKTSHHSSTAMLMVTRKSIRKRLFMQVKILWRQMLLKHWLGFSSVALISACKRGCERTLILAKEAVKKCFQAYRCYMLSLSSGIRSFILAWKSASPVLAGLDRLKDLSVLSLEGRKNDRFITTQISPLTGKQYQGGSNNLSTKQHRFSGCIQECNGWWDPSQEHKKGSARWKIKMQTL